MLLGPRDDGRDAPVRVGIVDTGVNPWHSHVGGRVDGCRLSVDERGNICRDDDFRDVLGHGTAVAGVFRETLPEAELFAVRVFDRGLATYPSLVARGILEAAAAGCRVINLSLGLAPEFDTATLRDACAGAQEAGCRLVAAGHPDRPGLVPASLPGVWGVTADPRLGPGEVAHVPTEPYPYRALGTPRDLDGFPGGANLSGHSFACARFAAHLASAVDRGRPWLRGHRERDRLSPARAQ